MNNDFLNNLLIKKRNENTEIEIHLFEYCNLACRFCGQDHNSKVGFDTIVYKSNDVIDFISRSPMSDHILNIMGGEVFNDLIPDELFNDYIEFATRIIDYCNANNQRITINWVTNLIYKKTDRVLNLLEKLGSMGQEVNLSTSYDFEGRGYAKMVNSLFAKNLELFSDYIYTIGFVLTSPSIKNLLKDDDPFFKILYKKHTLYFDYYVPEETNCDVLMPSDQELLDAFLFTAKNYPNVFPVSDWMKNETNKMTCYSLNKLTVLPDGKHVTCRYLSYKKGSFENEVNYTSNANIIESYINKNECLSCMWYDRCSFRCFVQADWVKRDRLDECLYKTFFNEVIEN